MEENLDKQNQMTYEEVRFEKGIISMTIYRNRQMLNPFGRFFFIFQSVHPVV